MIYNFTSQKPKGFNNSKVYGQIINNDQKNSFLKNIDLKFIKDVVLEQLERIEIINEEIKK